MKLDSIGKDYFLPIKITHLTLFGVDYKTDG